MNQVSIGSDNGLSPIRWQAIIWTNAGLLSIEPLGTNFIEILIKIEENAFENVGKKAAILSRGDRLKAKTTPELWIIDMLTNTVSHH